MARAISVRPAPTSPARPRISPRRTESETSSSTVACGSRAVAAARQALDRERDVARLRRPRGALKSAFTSRPTIMRMMPSIVVSATAPLPTSRPSRSTV